MRLISPGALWWLLLAAPIIILYLLKLKRTRQVVSSILLWRRAIQEMQANVPFRKLRRNLLLILQLAVLGLIVLALARPAITSHALARGSTMIVVDATASMAAHDEGSQTRLGRAKQLVGEMLRGVGGPTRAALIEAGGRPRLVCPLSSDRSRLTAALDEINQTDEAGDLREAVLLAVELAKAQQGSEVVVISDGGASSSPVDLKPVRVRYLRVGQRSGNVGIVAMNTRALPGGRQELFASVANFSDSERSLQAELRINSVLIDVRAIRLGPRPGEAPSSPTPEAGPADNGRISSRRSLIFDSLPPDGGVAELKLDIEDDLAADNVAFAIVRPSRRPSVGVAASNRFVLQALASDPDIEAHKIDAGQGPDLAPYDVVIAEGDQVARVLGSNRPVLCINPPDLAGLWVTEKTTSAPSAAGSISADASHPVNNFISYDAVNFDHRKVLKAATLLKPIVSDSNGGLIWAGEDNGRRMVLLGFDLAKTDLPVRMEFPILIANSIAWLSPAAGGAGSANSGDGQNVSVRTGQPFRLQSAASRITIQGPDGNQVQCEVRDGVATFENTDRVGTYIAKETGATLRASLLSALESDTRPRDSLSSTGGQIENSVETYRSDREIWTWVVYGALMVLVVEWMVYLRRALGSL